MAVRNSTSLGQRARGRRGRGRAKAGKRAVVEQVIEERKVKEMGKGGDGGRAKKHVLITAPEIYARRLAAALERASAGGVDFLPLISSTVGCESLVEKSAEEQDLLARIEEILRGGSFTHLALTSRHGIDACAAAMEAVCKLGMEGIDGNVFEAVRQSGVVICGLGADGHLIEQKLGGVPFLPEEASTQGLVKELVRRGDAGNARILVPVPVVEAPLVEPDVIPLFLQALEKAGAYHTVCPAYRTVLDPGAPERRSALLNGEIDAIVLSSTAEAQGLIMLAGSLDILLETLEKNKIVVAAHGPYTAGGARKLGIPVSVCPTEFKSFENVSEALRLHYIESLGEKY